MDKIQTEFLTSLREANEVPSDLKDIRDEYKKVLKYFNSDESGKKIDWNNLDKCWSNVFGKNLANVTGVDVKTLNSLRQSKISKYSKSDSGMSVKTILAKILKGFPSGLLSKEGEEDAYMAGLEALTEYANMFYSSPTAWETRKHGSSNDIRFGPTFLSANGVTNKRVTGAIRDALRSDDLLSKAIRGQVEKIKKFDRDYMQEHNRHPSDKELAEFLGVSEEKAKEYKEYLTFRASQFDEEVEMVRGSSYGKKLKSGQGGYSGYYDLPEVKVMLAEQMKFAAGAIKRKTRNKTRLAIELYIFEDVTDMKELAAILGLENGNKAQELLDQAVDAIKSELKDIDWDRVQSIKTSK